MRRSLLALLGLALILGSCATGPRPLRQDRAVEVVQIFNTQSPSIVVEHVRLPFLIQDEAVYSEADFTAVLERLRDNELVLDVDSLELLPVPQPTPEARFALGVYYDELPLNARAAVVSSNAGPITIFLGGEYDGLPQLLGLQRGAP